MGTQQQNIKSLPVTLFVSVFQEKGKETGAQLRARTLEPALMKEILHAAYRGEQVTFFVSFQDKAKALNALIQHGLIIPESTAGGTKYKFIE